MQIEKADCGIGEPEIACQICVHQTGSIGDSLVRHLDVVIQFKSIRHALKVVFVKLMKKQQNQHKPVKSRPTICKSVL